MLTWVKRRRHPHNGRPGLDTHASARVQSTRGQAGRSPYSCPRSARRSGAWRMRSGRTECMNQTAVDSHENWLDPDDLALARRWVPILYVSAVPVRVDEAGVATAVGLLLRATDDGEIRQELTGGRVLHHERIRDALLRHLEKDLGPLALPQIPVSPLPYTVAEFFPTPGITPYHDPRQHAVALAFVVPVTGDCAPRQDALELAWLSPHDAAADSVQKEMAGGHGMMLRQALAHLGFPPAHT